MASETSSSTSSCPTLPGSQFHLNRNKSVSSWRRKICITFFNFKDRVISVRLPENSGSIGLHLPELRFDRSPSTRKLIRKPTQKYYTMTTTPDLLYCRDLNSAIIGTLRPHWATQILIRDEAAIRHFLPCPLLECNWLAVGHALLLECCDVQDAHEPSYAKDRFLFVVWSTVVQEHGLLCGTMLPSATTSVRFSWDRGDGFLFVLFGEDRGFLYDLCEQETPLAHGVISNYTGKRI